MKLSILTIFPEMIENFLGTSIIKRACDKGIIEVNAVNIRDFAQDKHNRVDDYPFGGDLGMLFKHEPVIRAYNSLCGSDEKPFCIMMSPRGMTFNQGIARELSQKKNIAIICGHYEGIDQRVNDNICDLELSMGDFVLTGGEICACAIADSVLRLIPGVLSEEGSFQNESHQNNLLEYPQYTRPSESVYGEVPSVLLSGHHKNIEKYRREMSLISTLSRRTDLFEKIELTKEDRKYLNYIREILDKKLSQ